MIPKIIHYCWLSDDPIPKDLQEYMKTWQIHLNDYEFILWDLHRFDINSSIWVKQAFDSKKYAFAADFIRLFAVYNMGGFYMDMDVEVKKSFNDLIDKPYIFGMESPDLIEAGIFGAEKENKFIGEVLNYYNKRRFILSDGKFDVRPLPSIFKEVLCQKYEIAFVTDGNVLFEDNKIYVFPMDYFTARDWPYRNYYITKSTYTVHHFAGSWTPQRYKIKSIIKKYIRTYLGEKSVQIIIDMKKCAYKKLGLKINDNYI